MNGLVKQIMVKEGDPVEKGQKLLIFEAMKMESEVTAERSGKVNSLKVKQGETVEAQAVLLVVAD
jgi:oxaloacetate decarboxylase alpha subunit